MHCSQYYYIGGILWRRVVMQIYEIWHSLRSTYAPDGVRHMGLDKYGGGRHMPRDSVISGTRF